MLGEMIRRLRRDRGLYQSDLAVAMNVSQSTIGSWEADMRRPDVDMLVKIADYFNVSMDYLVGRVVNDQKPTPEPIADDVLSQKHFALKRITHGFDADQMDDMLDLAAIVDRRSKNRHSETRRVSV